MVFYLASAASLIHLYFTHIRIKINKFQVIKYKSRLSTYYAGNQNHKSWGGIDLSIFIPFHNIYSDCGCPLASKWTRSFVKSASDLHWNWLEDARTTHGKGHISSATAAKRTLLIMLVLTNLSFASCPRWWWTSSRYNLCPAAGLGHVFSGLIEAAT